MSTLFLLLLIAASSIQGSVSERHFFSQIYFPAYLIASTSSTTSSLCHKRDFFRTLLCLQANFRELSDSGNSKQVDSTSSAQLFAVDTQLENSTDLEGESQNIIEIEVANQKKVSALLKSLLPVLSDKANPRAFLLDVFVPWCSTCQKIKPLIGTAARLLSKVEIHNLSIALIPYFPFSRLVLQLLRLMARSRSKIKTEAKNGRNCRLSFNIVDNSATLPSTCSTASRISP